MQETTPAELLERAHSLITGKPKATKDDKKAVEVNDPILANELLALREELATQIKELSAKKSEIDAIIKDAIGSADALTVHGAIVASISRWRQTELNKEFIEENFKLADYPEMYVRTSKSRLDVKR